eukprot:1239689-Prymnesium_polylepis.1
MPRCESQRQIPGSASAGAARSRPGSRGSSSCTRRPDAGRTAVAVRALATQLRVKKENVQFVTPVVVRFVPHAGLRRVGHPHGRLELVQLRVRAHQPAKVVVVVGMVDRHRLVALAARRVARKPTERRAPVCRWRRAGVRHLVDLIPGDRHHLAAEALDQLGWQGYGVVARPVHLRVLRLHGAVHFKVFDRPLGILEEVERVVARSAVPVGGGARRIGDLVGNAALVHVGLTMGEAGAATETSMGYDCFVPPVTRT